MSKPAENTAPLPSHLAPADGPVMDLEQIKQSLPHRYPFLLVDRILEVKPGESARGLKNVTANEEFFNGHFPGKPLMPGVLIVEAMAQVCGVLAYSMEPDPESKWLLFAGIDKARFKTPVIPGDQLVMDVKIIGRKLTMAVFEAKARVDGKVAAQGELRMALVPR